MANRRTSALRGGKRVLARQCVSRSAKPGSSRPREGSILRDILAVFLFIGSIGLLCALWTYTRADSSAGGVENAIGPAGHHLASALFGLVGLCAYLVPVALFYASLALFGGGRGRRRGRQIAGLVILALSGAVLAHLLSSGEGWAYPPGGAWGAALGEGLRGLFSTFGAVLLMSATAAGGLIVATDSAFARLCVRVGTWAAESARAGGAALFALGQQALAELKRRREEKRQERLREEAALAQSLADAEEALEAPPATTREEAPAVFDELELDEGEEPAEGGSGRAEELTAAEADAVAEEAARLAREAEERKARDEAYRRASEAALRVAHRARALPTADPPWALASPVPAPASAAQAPSLPGTVEPPPGAAAEGLEQPRQEPIPVVGPVLPVIVEPKAPPRPAKPEKKDPFAIAGPSTFSLPPITLLEEPPPTRTVLDKDVYFATAERLREKLASFGIDGQVKEIRPGPVVTMYEFEPAPGIKISKIASLADDLAMAMEALKVRIVAPIPGKGVVGIEVPNKTRETVYLREIVEQDAFLKSPSKLAMALGKNIEGMPYVADLARMPHLLIAGTTGSGKSVSVNAMIMSFLFKATPEEVRLIMVDPKVTELSLYEGIPHLLLPVVTDARKAALALRWAVEEMERRYQLLAEAGVRNIGGYNKWVERTRAQAPARPAESATIEARTAGGSRLRIIDVEEGETEDEALARLSREGQEAPPSAEGAGESAASSAEDQDAEPAPPRRKLPYIVIIIDEVADLMMVASREVETYVARLAQMARAAGIHLMIATQRPSIDVITGVIKANFPSRISFQLRSKPDSMTILGTTGAESLLGMGDMLILPPTSAHLERVHGAYVSDQEIARVVEHLKAQGKPVYDESILRPRDEEAESGGEDEHADEMYDQCLALVSEMRQVSVSMLQRKLRLGYNRAARIIERMEREGVVGPANGSRPREVLIRPVGEMHREVNV